MPLLAKGRTIPGYYDVDTVRAGTKMPVGMNGGFHRYYSGDFPFINALKQGAFASSSAVPGGTVGFGYPDTSTSGSTTYLIHAMDDQNLPKDPAAYHPYLFTGVWILRWKGNPTSVLWTLENGGGPPGTLTSVTPDAGWDGQAEYNVTDAFANNGGTRLTTSGPGAATEIQLITPGDKARLDAGNIFNTQFLTDLAGIDTFRTMEWLETNDSPIYNAGEFRDLNDIIWTSFEGMPIEALARVAIELDCKLWVNVPAMAQPAAVTEMFDKLKTVWDAAGYDYTAKPPYVEYTNEYWNSALGFFNGYKWQFKGTAPILEITNSADINTVTGIYTKTAHGYSDDDEIVMWNALQLPFDSEYGRGSSLYIIKVDDNNFKLCRRFERNFITGITFGATTTITAYSIKSDGTDDVNHYYNFQAVTNNSTTHRTHDVKIIGTGTELDGNTYKLLSATPTQYVLEVDSNGFTPYVSGGRGLATQNISKASPSTQEIDSSTDFARWSLESAHNGTNHLNYGNNAKTAWALAETVLGVGNLKKVTGWQSGSAATIKNQLAAHPDMWQIADYGCLTHYFTTKPANFDTKTPTELTDLANYNWIHGLKSPMRAIEEHTSIKGSYTALPIIGYETGDHNGGDDDATQLEVDALVEWARDDECTRAYDEHARLMSYQGSNLLCQFVAHSAFDISSAGGFQGTFGMMEHTGDTDSKQYLALQPFFAEGVPASDD